MALLLGECTHFIVNSNLAKTCLAKFEFNGSCTIAELSETKSHSTKAQQKHPNIKSCSCLRGSFKDFSWGSKSRTPMAASTALRNK